MILAVVIIIALLSFLFAYRSLLHVTRMQEIEGVKKELSKGKVVFHKDSSQDSSSEPS